MIYRSFLKKDRKRAKVLVHTSAICRFWVAGIEHSCRKCYFRFSVNGKVKIDNGQLSVVSD